MSLAPEQFPEVFEQVGSSRSSLPQHFHAQRLSRGCIFQLLQENLLLLVPFQQAGLGVCFWGTLGARMFHHTPVASLPFGLIIAPVGHSQQFSVGAAILGKESHPHAEGDGEGWSAWQWDSLKQVKNAVAQHLCFGKTGLREKQHKFVSSVAKQHIRGARWIPGCLASSPEPRSPLGCP